MTQEKIDLLLSLIASGDAGDAQWREFEALADGEPSLWREVAESVRDQRSLGRAMNTLVAAADGVDLPDGATTTERRHAPSSGRWPMRVVNWSGWAVAAVLALVAGLRLAAPGGGDAVEPAVPPTPTPVVMRPTTPDDAIKAYLSLGREAGQVVGEMPTKVLLDSRPSETGEGYDLLYLRQFIERTHVPDLYRVEGQNDQGVPKLKRWEQPVQGSM